MSEDHTDTALAQDDTAAIVAAATVIDDPAGRTAAHIVNLTSAGKWWLAGYQRGVQSGYAAGYAEAMAVLDDAGALLAEQRPSKVVPFARLQEIRTTYKSEALTPEQIRVNAAQSWGITR
jgi:hypothetical protein